MAKILPPDDTLATLPEVLILKQRRATGEGVIIRDLSSIDNENIYVTGLGREIAEKNGSEFGVFWKKYYSENLGKAITEIKTLLQLDDTKTYQIKRLGIKLKPRNCADIKTVEEMNVFLKTPEGQAAIRAYHKRIGTLPRIKALDESVYQRRAELNQYQWASLIRL